MFNVRLRNLLVVLFLLLSLILTFGCSNIPGLSSKPSEDEMKSIINAIEGVDWNIEEFKITNGFNKKLKDENWYCIEVNYKVVNKEDKTFIGEMNVRRYSFVKRGNSWYGYKEWDLEKNVN